MRTKPVFRYTLAALACVGLGLVSLRALPEDIDIFTVDQNNTVQVPNVLFVIDNSSNWSRASQQWPPLPSGVSEIQGQSEVDAIKQVILNLDTNFNVGFMEFITSGSSSDQDSGFLRYHIRPMTSGNKTNFANILTTIYGAINDPIEKRPQADPFGKIMWDVYNYLSGIRASNGGAGTPSSLADADAYSSQYSVFRSPLSSTADACRRTVVIFIGNNVSSGPTGDSQDTIDALYNISSGGTYAAPGSDTTTGANSIAQIPFADYAIQTRAATATLDYSACFSSQSACVTALNTATSTGTVCTDQGFTSCTCDAADTIACPSTHWSVVGRNTASTVLSDDTTSTAHSYTGGITYCQKNQPNGTCTTPSGTTTTTTTDPSTGNTTTKTTSFTGSCAYETPPTLVSGQPANDSSCPVSNAAKVIWYPAATQVVRTIVRGNVTTTSNLSNTTACYNDATICTSSITGSASCPSSTYNNGCTCTTATDSTGCGAGAQSKYRQKGSYNIIEAAQTGTYHAAPTGQTTTYMMDEWARYLRQVGVPVPGATPAADGTVPRVQVTTYTIDVFHDQQNPDFSALLFNAARVGGGKYFQAKDKNSLINALKEIFNEVQAVNTAFSSASLPVNATNRAQNENQVFIGVFKPDRQKRPLWFGNLKRYQLISTGVTIELGDAAGNAAINPNTGFITDCAVSYWTVDSTFNNVPYWSHNTIVDPLPLGGCTTNSTSDLSDSPDGPFVEKGAAAEVLRRGNDPTASADSDGNYALNRTVYTKDSSTAANATMPLFTAAAYGSANASTGLTDNVVNFIRGADVLDEDTDSATPPAVPLALTEPRSSIHGDVVHSRPQPINYGGSTGVVVYYGSNNGMFHAVKASTGQELWSFVAPEHYHKFQRLFSNSPLIQYWGDTSGATTPKDYFFDGSTGVYQTFNADGTSNKAWIFATMHRGGRKVYGFDVSTPTAPKYMWSKGCDDNNVCDSGFSAMGQTWSFPNVGFIKGYSTTTPVIVIGGGYDTSDDDGTYPSGRTPAAATRGRGVYVINAQTGALVRYFDFSSIGRDVAADVALIDIDNDKNVDYAYAADTGGNLYRMDFIDGPVTKNPVTDPTQWRWSRVAYTSGAYRKFLFTPALVQATSSVVYLALGSGDREHPLMSQYPFGLLTDPSTAVMNRFYVFKDDLTDVDSSTVLNLDDPTLMINESSSNSCSATAVTPSSSQKGWYINLDSGQGEQTVTSAVIAAGFVFFSTNRPTPDSTTACTNSLGEARGYFVNLLNGSGAIGVNGACGGTRSSTFVGGGLPPSPVLATVPIGGVLRTVVIGAVQKTGEPSSPIEAQRVRPPIASDRKPIYWYKSTGDK